METTTIQLQKKTKAILDMVKDSHGSKTYDDVILRLLMKKTPSMAGKFRIKGVNTMAELMKGLRDKHDRF